MVIDVASALQSSPLGILLNRVSQIAHLTSYHTMCLGVQAWNTCVGSPCMGRMFGAVWGQRASLYTAYTPHTL